MTDFSTIRDAIKTTLENVDGIGKIQARERYSNSTKDLRQFYADDSNEKGVDGGFIRRTGRKSVSPDDSTFTQEIRWEIHYVRSWVDEDNSSDAFDMLIDKIAAEFEKNVTLGGVVQTTKDYDQAAITLVDSKPAMFAGILVHYGVMTLKTFDVYCV